MRVVLACLLLVGLALASPAGDKYTTKYDNIDLDEILNNERLYKKYFDCLSSKGKCTPDGKELKEIIPDALKTGCAKCNDKQRKGSEKVLVHLIQKKKDDFNTLERIYDPQGVYLKKYKGEAEKRGIKLD